MPFPDNEDPMVNWEYDCEATTHECDGKSYLGGFGECAVDNKFSRTYPKADFYPGLTSVKLTGRVWAFDSWDGESISVVLTSGGQTLGTWTKSDISFREHTLQCPGTSGNADWKD
jgi:hypothetical protein